MSINKDLALLLQSGGTINNNVAISNGSLIVNGSPIVNSSGSWVGNTTGLKGEAGLGLDPITFSGSVNVPTNLTPGVVNQLFGYRTTIPPWAEGQYVTFADQYSGSTLVYYGTLEFTFAGGFGWAFGIDTLVSVSGSPAGGESTNQTWIMNFAAAPAGAKGDTGTTGSTGAKGDKGEVGVKGDAGVSANQAVNTSSDVTFNTVKITALPGFRVYGSGTTNNLTTTQNTYGALNSDNWAVEFNQGTAGLNSSTGVFTAPVAGLYQVNIVGRNAGYSGGISQLGVTKNGTSGGLVGGQCIAMIEFAASSSMNHTGASTTINLAVNDTLALKVLAGQINFDGNDNWSVVFLG